MGQIRTPECERIEIELTETVRPLVTGEVEVEACQDTYTQDYIIWINLDGQVWPIRIQLEEFTEDDWKGNIRKVLGLEAGRA